MKNQVARRWMSVALTAGMALAIGLVGTSTASAGDRPASAKANDRVDWHYNLLGYEGIATLGATGFTSGQTPPVGDYVTTHCRYIIAQNTTLGHYYLRYPIHVPDGALITAVKLFVADFNPTGVIWAYLRSRQWNSRDAGTTLSFTLTDNSSSNDKQVEMGGLSISVNNANKVYWVDVSPENSANPGQLCVYGIQVVYDCASCPLFADGFESGSTGAWSAP